MSFNKIGNGYYNNDLCKCLLSTSGAYFVELKNGVKVNISKDDYDAMADGLLSVNGVKYCDPTLVASAKHIGAKYIVEFSNGNQFSISQSDYEGLIAAGFVAIGDIYYNPDDIDKVYAVAGGYFAEMVNGQKVVMTEEEYDAIVGGDEPAGGLTPFEVGQTISGYDFGDVSNTDTSVEMDAFLTGIPSESFTDGMYDLVGSTDVGSWLVGVFDLQTLGAGTGRALMCLANDGEHEAETAVYCTDVGGSGITRGFQNLTDGKLAANDTYTVQAPINQITGWNGVLIGAVLAQ